MIVFALGKIDGEKPHGFRYVKSAVFGHGVFDTRTMRLLTSAHPIWRSLSRYRFEAGKRWVRKKSLMRNKDGIRAKTKRTRGESLSRVIADLNPMLRGWYGYFKHAHPSVFRTLDGFLRRRLRALLRKQEKRPGRGRCLADHQRWTNASFAEVGLFALYPAWQTERHSR